MASEELLDRMAARLRSYSIFGQDDEDRAVLSAYDDHRQMAGEGCPNCGSTGLHACTGRFPEPMTENERRLSEMALRNAAEAINASQELQLLREQMADPATVRVPRELTAENGAKAALMGEFFETITDSRGNRIPTAISWTTIKAIYKAAIDHFSAAEAER